MDGAEPVRSATDRLKAPKRLQRLPMKLIDFHIHPPGPGGPLDAGAGRDGRVLFRGASRRHRPRRRWRTTTRSSTCSACSVRHRYRDGDGTAAGAEPVLRRLREALADTFTAFGNVDPWKGAAAVRETERVKDLGLKGLKFHPSSQQFYPNDQRFYPLWQKAQELGLIVLFHTGTTGVGAGRPGGGGIKLGTRARSRTWTTSRPTSRAEHRHGAPGVAVAGGSSWRCSSTSPTSTWTSQAGRRSTSRRR